MNLSKHLAKQFSELFFGQNWTPKWLQDAEIIEAF